MDGEQHEHAKEASTCCLVGRSPARNIKISAASNTGPNDCHPAGQHSTTAGSNHSGAAPSLQPSRLLSVSASLPPA